MSFSSESSLMGVSICRCNPSAKAIIETSAPAAIATPSVVSVARSGRATQPVQGQQDDLPSPHGAAPPRARKRPSRRWIVRSATRPTISSSCVTITTVVPSSRWTLSSSATTSAAVARSRLPVGSSASRSGGRWTIARAMATRCCSPPLSWSGRCPARWLKSDQPNRLGGQAGPLGAECALERQGQGHVLAGGQARHEVIRLEDQAHHRAPVDGPLVRAQRRQVAAVDQHAAGGRRIQPAQQVQERRLSRAAHAQDREKLAAPHLKIDPASARTMAGPTRYSRTKPRAWTKGALSAAGFMSTR